MCIHPLPACLVGCALVWLTDFTLLVTSRFLFSSSSSPFSQRYSPSSTTISIGVFGVLCIYANFRPYATGSAKFHSVLARVNEILNIAKTKKKINENSATTVVTSRFIFASYINSHAIPKVCIVSQELCPKKKQVAQVEWTWEHLKIKLKRIMLDYYFLSRQLSRLD